MSGHFSKPEAADQATYEKQKNGWQKNGDESLCGLHFSARHFSA